LCSRLCPKRGAWKLRPLKDRLGWHARSPGGGALMTDDARARLAVVLARWRDATAEVAECLGQLAAENAQPPAAPALWTVAQVAEHLRRSRSAVRGWCEVGRFPGAFKHSRNWCVPREGVEAFVAEQWPETPRR